MSAVLAQVFYAQAVSSTVSGSFYDLVGGRFYLERNPQNMVLPLAVYSVMAVDIEQFQGSVKHIMQVDVSAFVLLDNPIGAVAAQNIDDALYSICEGTNTLAPTGFDRAQILCRSRGALQTFDDAFGVSSSWTVTGWKS